MRLQFFSDSHFEYHKDGGNAFIERLDPTDVDVLVMVGDIMYLKEFSYCKRQFQKILDKYQQVIYVPGNHEYYTSSVELCSANIERLQVEFDGALHIFQGGGAVTISGQRFVGGTMWYRNAPDNFVWEDRMNDRRSIKGFVPWVYEQNEAFDRYITTKLCHEDVVVTHYMPSYECVENKYRGSMLNRFFVCDQDRLIVERQPKLWIAGHSHAAWDFKIYNTHLVGNPIGYPGERNDSNPQLIVEI